MTPEEQRQAVGIGQETTSGTPVAPMQWVPEKREKPWWAKSEFWNGDELEMGDDGVPLLVTESERRGAERLAIDHAREGKIKALQYVKGHLLMNYCCVPDRCRNTKVPNKKCICSKNRMLMGIVDDINQEMNAVLNQRYLRHL